MRGISGMIAVMTVAAALQGQSAPQAVSDAPGAKTAATEPDLRTEKQKALAMQADRLYDMAQELKAQVDKTNKNILSLKVVEKAEEIEALAKGMRGQAKK